MNIDILRLEINELLYHVEVFLGTDKKLEMIELLKGMVNDYIIPSNNPIDNTPSIIPILKNLEQDMDKYEYMDLLNNTSNLTWLINHSY